MAIHETQKHTQGYLPQKELKNVMALHGQFLQDAVQQVHGLRHRAPIRFAHLCPQLAQQDPASNKVAKMESKTLQRVNTPRANARKYTVKRQDRKGQPSTWKKIESSVTTPAPPPLTYPLLHKKWGRGSFSMLKRTDRGVSSTRVLPPHINFNTYISTNQLPYVENCECARYFSKPFAHTLIASRVLPLSKSGLKDPTLLPTDAHTHARW